MKELKAGSYIALNVDWDNTEPYQGVSLHSFYLVKTDIYLPEKNYETNFYEKYLKILIDNKSITKLEYYDCEDWS